MKLKILVGLLVIVVMAGAQEQIVNRNVKGKPDLLIVDLRAVPDPLISGRNYGVHFTIKNKGGAIVEHEFWAELFIDTGVKPIRQIVIKDYIEPGGEKQYSFEDIPSFTDTGSHQIKVSVDSHAGDEKLDDIVEESDERNNVLTKAVSVQSIAAAIIKREDGVIQDDATSAYPKVAIDRTGGSSGDSAVGKGLALLAILGIVALVIGATAILYIKHKGGASAQSIHMGDDSELKRLQREKEEIEEMIRIAKVKFYKRKLDEESYKSIVKDNQEKLIKIEAEINGLERRVKKLEDMKE